MTKPKNPQARQNPHARPARRYLVTGGAGFIGSHIAAALAARGDFVRIFDNFATGKRENLAAAPGAELVEGDLRDFSAIRRACEGIDVVFHEAALPSVARSVEDPVATDDINIRGTLHTLLAAKETKVKRVVYAGSSSAYGESPTLPKQEDMAPDPISPYGVSKLAGEQYCRAFARVYGLETVVLRYFNVFGPRQDPGSPYSGVIALFCTAALAGTKAKIHGDGEQSRDFTYVENVVSGNLLAAERNVPAGSVLNCATGASVTLNDLVRALGELTGRKLAVQHGPDRAGDIRHSLADIARAKRILGYEPRVSFADGLARTLEWYRGTVPSASSPAARAAAPAAVPPAAVSPAAVPPAAAKNRKNTPNFTP
jgi:UDP-glucose 4-epimerase